MGSATASGRYRLGVLPAAFSRNELRGVKIKSAQ